MTRLLLSGLGLGSLTVAMFGLSATQVCAQTAGASPGYVVDAQGFPRAISTPPSPRYVNVAPGDPFVAAPVISPPMWAHASALDQADRPASLAPGGEVVRTIGVRDAMPWGQTVQEVAIAGDDHVDRLQVRQQGWIMRPGGGPIPADVLSGQGFEPADFDVRLTRGWSHLLARSDDGMELAVEPHAGLQIGSRGGAAVAGATVRIGRDLQDLVADGREAFGDRKRWYVFAAGSGRAVGYNWARGGDGSYARSGMSQDDGAFMGDATLGVAVRQGPVQGSVGVMYREVEIDGLRGINGLRTDVGEGLVGFQLSIKP